MSETPRKWKYLERRPGSSYQQLCIKGKRIWAWTLYCEFMNEKEPRTPEQLAEMDEFVIDMHTRSGLLGEMMMRTYFESQHRAPYNVRALINFEND